MDSSPIESNDESYSWLRKICPFTYDKNRFVVNNRNICNTILPVPKILLDGKYYVVTMGIIIVENELICQERSLCTDCKVDNLIIELPSADTMKSFCYQCGKVVYEPVNRSIKEFYSLLKLYGDNNKYYKSLLSFDQVVDLIADVR